MKDVLKGKPNDHIRGNKKVEDVDMKKARRFASLMLAAALTSAFLTGCGGSKDASQGSAAAGTEAAVADEGSSGNVTADGKTVIRVGMNADPASFGPFESGGNGKNYVYRIIYEPLAEYQGVGGEVKGVIAKEWEKIDPVTYQVTIWDNIYDTAGNHMTADDVVFTYTSMKDTGNFTDLRYMDSISKVDDYTVEFKLNQETIGLFEKILQASRCVTQAAYEASSDEMATTPVGTTAYEMVDYVSGSQYTFEKAESYWQSEENFSMYQPANVDRVEYYYIPENSQLAIALESGTVDMVCGISYTEAQRFMEGGQNAEGFTVFEDLQNLSQVLFFQCSENSPCNNEKLRQAIMYAIDLQGLIDGAAHGQATACATFGGNMFSDYDPEWETSPKYTYDIEKAKQLLDESGFDTSTPLRIVLNGDSTRKSIAQIIQGYLAQIGISVEINSYEDSLFNTYKSDETAYDLLLDNCGGSDYLMTIWRGKFDNTAYTTGGTINGIYDDELQSLMEACKLDNSKENMDAFHNYLYDHAYSAGLFNAQMFTVCIDDVKEISLDSKQFLYAPACVYSWN